MRNFQSLDFLIFVVVVSLSTCLTGRRLLRDICHLAVAVACNSWANHTNGGRRIGPAHVVCSAFQCKRSSAGQHRYSIHARYAETVQQFNGKIIFWRSIGSNSRTFWRRRKACVAPFIESKRRFEIALNMLHRTQSIDNENRRTVRSIFNLNRFKCSVQLIFEQQCQHKMFML